MDVVTIDSVGVQDEFSEYADNDRTSILSWHSSCHWSSCYSNNGHYFYFCCYYGCTSLFYLFRLFYKLLVPSLFFSFYRYEWCGVCVLERYNWEWLHSRDYCGKFAYIDEVDDGGSDDECINVVLGKQYNYANGYSSFFNSFDVF